MWTLQNLYRPREAFIVTWLGLLLISLSPNLYLYEKRLEFSKIIEDLFPLYFSLILMVNIFS